MKKQYKLSDLRTGWKKYGSEVSLLDEDDSLILVKRSIQGMNMGGDDWVVSLYKKGRVNGTKVYTSGRIRPHELKDVDTISKVDTYREQVKQRDISWIKLQILEEHQRHEKTIMELEKQLKELS